MQKTFLNSKTFISPAKLKFLQFKMWHDTSLGFKTKIIKKDFNNPNKQAYNDKVCAGINNYSNHMFKVDGNVTMCALVLDALHCATTTQMVKQCHFPLEWIHIVSYGIAFQKQRGCKIGALHSGDLYDYLLRIAAADEIKFDVLVLDFCRKYEAHEDCLRILFEQQLIDDMALLTVTFCARNKKGNDYCKQEKLEAANKIAMMAIENGYTVRVYDEHEHKTMFSLFFKVIHNMGAQKEVGGIKKTKDGRDASNWLFEK